MEKTELQFGISLMGGIEKYIDAMKIIDISIFTRIELPGAYLDNRRERNSFDSQNDLFTVFNQEKRRFQVISVSDIAAANIAGEMDQQSKKIQDDFISNMRKAIDDLITLHIKQCTLNISPEDSFSNETRKRAKIKLLKKICPLLIEKGITVSLPVRIPSATGIDFSNYPSLLRETMCPNFKLAVNIYPHEIKNDHIPFDLLRNFRFLMNKVSFIYEPDAGNYLVDKLLNPWFKVLEEFNYDKTVFFTPRTNNIVTLGREMERLSDLVKKYQASKRD